MDGKIIQISTDGALFAMEGSGYVRAVARVRW